MVQIGTVVSEKIRFEFLYVHDLGPRSRNDLDFQYSAEPHDYTRVIEALPDKLDIKRHSPGILYISSYIQLDVTGRFKFKIILEYASNISFFYLRTLQTCYQMMHMEQQFWLNNVSMICYFDYVSHTDCKIEYSKKL